MEETIKCVVLEDGIEYAIVNEIKTPQTTYVYLTNINDEEDFCIRKVTYKDEKPYLTGLSDEEEYKRALNYFYQNLND